MPGRGPLPKDPSQRRRRNSEVRHELGPPPSEYPAFPWEGMGSATERWYRTWATSPQASRFTPTDWQRLHMLAPLVEQYFQTAAKDLMTEIRLNEALLGATEADRLRLHWDMKESKPVPAKAKTSAPRLRVVDDGGSSSGQVASG